MTNLTKIFSVVIILLVTTALKSQPDFKRQWTSYRGNFAAGWLDDANLPAGFDFKKNTNIKWKKELPGLGIASPVIWEDKLFITTAVSEADREGFKPGLYGDVASVGDSSVHEWIVYCIDKRTGKTIWERTACRGIPAMKRHPKSTHANTTPATDGKYVVAFFGSEGLYCYDYNGTLVWKKDFGILKSVFFTMEKAEWEFASSPIIHNGVVIIQCDVLDNSFIAAYEVSTGKELWKTSRDEYPGWCTPNIYMHEGKTLIAVNGYKHRGGYDFLTGKEVWKMSGGGDIQIPTPIIGDGLIFFNSAHGRSSPVMAVKTSANGDITLKEGESANSGILWSLPRGGSYMHTMLLYRNKLYNINWNGTINCIDPATGKEIYNARLGKAKSFIASPVASDGKIYIVDEEGTVYVIGASDKFEILAEIPMGEISMTAPAITDGIIFFRNQKYLIAVGND